ncbi:DNA-binding transcriptional regulator, MerR family [Catalinimonas alkaloidigena]|uniref:DNA-binding transcriptional regulator, MerR family n=1 Tax=Catalinimonas alkaloidigena TaxID=1075417 RepID=A0A1G9BYN9_9BACT|nr:MerR family transcriptional regulator [Catalinimonas alkaloidigena]SDK44520.1 DNA-binding transcriptional regulator, MerR family [Catalinimonas alkaloidigena]
MDEIEKRYYTIGELAQMLGVNASLIRFWETEFPSIQPKKNRKGNRIYTQKDVDQIQRIYHLVKERGYKLQGARDELRKQNQVAAERTTMKRRLEKVRSFLLEMKESLPDA